MDKLIYKEKDGDLTCRSRDFDKVFATLYAYEETNRTPEQIEEMRVQILNLSSLVCDLYEKKEQAYAELESLRNSYQQLQEINDRTFQSNQAMGEDLKRYKQAEEEGRLIILPPPAKEGDPKPNCFYNDNGGIWCLGMAPADGDEPTERCKQCWYCEFGYAALAEDNNVPSQKED